MDKLIAVFGILTILGVGVALSESRRRISIKLPATFLACAFVLGLLILKVPGTSDLFQLMGRGVDQLLGYSAHGAVFDFGETLTFGKFFQPGDPNHMEFVFAIRIGFAIIFVSMLSALGYHFGILQRMVKVLARGLRFLGLSGPESLICGAASCFVGQVDAQLLAKPYMPTLTRSEMFTTMTVGMATISASVLGPYALMGMPITYLICASMMSSLNAIAIAKIFCPETQPEKLVAEANMVVPIEGNGVFDAAAHGIDAGLKIAVKVIIYVGMAIAAVDLLNAGFEHIVGIFGIHASLTDVVAYPFMPIAWLTGVPWHEAYHVGHLMASELLYNEFVSYGELGKVMAGGGAAPYILAAKTQLIATAVLCGFAHPGSIAINIGGLGAMAPERRGEIAGMALKSMMVANMATWITAAMCGLMF